MCLAIPGLLETRDGDDPLFATGNVRFGGVVKNVSQACVPEAVVGDYVLVHAGIGIGTIDEDEARRIFEMLEELDDLRTAEDVSKDPPQ